jgi:sulfonate transport system permease protein
MNRRVVGLSLEILSPIAVIVAWWFLSADSKTVFFPPLQKIVEALYDDWIFTRVSKDLVPSLTRLGIGYAIVVVGGIVIGTAFGMSRTLWRAFGPILEFLRALPPPVLIPFSLLVLGVGAEMKVFVIAIGSIWPVLLNSTDGVRGVDPQLLEVSRVYGLSRSDRIFRVVLPAASPQIFAGMRTSLSIAVILMVISEMVASVNGVGYYVLQSQRAFRIPEMWAGIILLGLIGYVLNVIFVLWERRVLVWHRGSRAAALEKPVQES